MIWCIIAVEGVDAVWKTTLAQWLAGSIANGIYYKTPWTKTPKERAVFDRDWVTIKERFEFYLEAYKADALRTVEMADEWKAVICDRFLASTIVHHQAMESTLDISEAEKLEFVVPKIQILLLASREVILARLSQREKLTRFEKDTNLFLRTQSWFLRRANDLIIRTDKHDIAGTLQQANLYLSNNNRLYG